MSHGKFNLKLLSLVSLLSIALYVCAPSLGQGRIAERLGHRFNAGSQIITKDNNGLSYRQVQLAGLNVAIWEPNSFLKPVPLIIFSHGFTGKNIQSAFLMQAFAKAGYLVMAPNHKDAVISGPRTGKQPAIAFKDASDWNDNTYRDRHDDIVGLIDQLKKDPLWKKRIDWSKVALCGHSLGGYTVLGLAGAWPSWKQKGIKAVLALSPYTEPYVVKGDLGNINIPVMYQGGRRDFGITPIVKNSAFAKTSSPAYFVEFNNMGHLGWTNYDQDPKERALIAYYCLSFLDKYLKHDPLANPEKKQLGVSEIRSK